MLDKLGIVPPPLRTSTDVLVRVLRRMEFDEREIRMEFDEQVALLDAARYATRKEAFRTLANRLDQISLVFPDLSAAKHSHEARARLVKLQHALQRVPEYETDCFINAANLMNDDSYLTKVRQFLGSCTVVAGL